MEERNFGLYILANDSVLPWLMPLLESIECNSPGLPVAIIPFDGEMTGVQGIRGRYHFEIMRSANLETFDSIGEGFFPRGTARHYFRKFAAFSGAFEHFLYLDSDCAVLTDLAPLFEAFAVSPFDLVAIDADINQVYWPGPLREKMVAEYKTLGFNCGSFWGRRGVLTLYDFLRLAASPDISAREMTRNLDQGFINFCVDTSGIRKCRISQIAGEFSNTAWARYRVVLEGEKFLLNESGHTEHGKRMAVLHWAGVRKIGATMPNPAIHRHFARGAWRSAEARASLAAELAAAEALPPIARPRHSARDEIASHFPAGDEIFFVQIGAHDGHSGDPLWEFVSSRPNWRGIMVEPLPECLEQLRASHRNRSGLQFENIAIAAESGTRILYFLDPACARQNPESIPPWHLQWSSFSREHVVKHLGQHLGFPVGPKFEDRIVERTVPTERLDSMLERLKVEQLDLLQVDVEGFDCEVVLQLDLDKFQPKVIMFEFCHSPPALLERLIARLEAHGYYLQEFDRDIIAVRK